MHETIFTHSNLILSYYPNEKVLYQKWLGITGVSLFKELIDRTEKELKKRACNHIIIDIREHLGLMPESRKYTAKRMAEFSLEYGSIWQSFILPKDEFSKISAYEYSEMLSTSVQIHTFFHKNPDDAFKWFANKKIS
jgi:hypothetical protein